MMSLLANGRLEVITFLLCVPSSKGDINFVGRVSLYGSPRFPEIITAVCSCIYLNVKIQVQYGTSVTFLW